MRGDQGGEKLILGGGGLFFFEASIVIFSADDWGVQSPPIRIVLRFHYHSRFSMFLF